MAYCASNAAMEILQQYLGNLLDYGAKYLQYYLVVKATHVDFV